MPGYYEKEIFKALLMVQDEIKKSGISTWCDHIPELQMFITQILRYEFSQHDPELCNQCLRESLKYHEPIRNYFLGSKDIQRSLASLFKVIHLAVDTQENKTAATTAKLTTQMLPVVNDAELKKHPFIVQQWQIKSGYSSGAIAVLAEVDRDLTLPPLLKQKPNHQRKNSITTLLGKLKLVR